MLYILKVINTFPFFLDRLHIPSSNHPNNQNFCILLTIPYIHKLLIFYLKLNNSKHSLDLDFFFFIK